MSNQQPQSSELNTGGGAFIKGAVHAGRDFIGRDQINHYARSQREELDDYLRKAISDYERDIERRRHPPTPDQPYKFLYPFTMADQAIFFGRDAAVEELLAKVGHPSRLTVLHAPSGAGKSSLLGAGLMPRLLDQDRLPLYVAVHQDAADPVLAIKKALTPESNGPWPELLPWLSLSAYLGEVTRHISRRFRDLVVILDQFEAFFVFSPEAVHRQPFINALADCLQDDSLPVRMVIALRKDYYSDLACFEPRLPYVFYNQYLLRPIDRREALIAITGPIEVVNPAVTLEETLITSLLDDLAHQEVRLPYLQIVCTQLYEECRSTTSSLTFTAYNKLGRTEGMLRRYLNQTLKWFGDRKNVAESILVALVTSAGTKLVVSKEALIGQIDTDPDTVQDVLAHLVGRRLLQVTQESGRVTYELAHEALGAEIEDWINPDVLLSKRILEMLQSEIANWRMFGTLIPKERLNLLSSYRKKMVVC